VPPEHLASICKEWRRQLFTDREWVRTEEKPISPGEAGGYRVASAEFPFSAYLKPLRVCELHEPRAANEKIVADIASDLKLSVPPVLLYRRQNQPSNEEVRCCISLVVYPEHHEWGQIWNLSLFPQSVQLLVRDALSSYSKTFALDLLIGQTDRNNQRNVVLGADAASPPNTEFLFLDHAMSLNYGNRWDNMGWKKVEMVPIPDILKSSLRKDLVLDGADQLADLADAHVQDIVERIPEDYMASAHRAAVIAGLNGRKHLLRQFVEQHLI